uniref:COMM domain-containing protein 6 n=1 Tax=Piliocolobus tephrosceles TaxID=591936 RepID=A0A8C9GXG3_9PRIM
MGLKSRYLQGRVPSEALVDFQWKLGMAVSSDTCRSLKYPYVAVMLKVADHSGQVKTKCFEMTIPQFQVCDLTLPILAHFFCNRRIKRQDIYFAFKYFILIPLGLMFKNVKLNESLNSADPEFSN